MRGVLPERKAYHKASDILQKDDRTVSSIAQSNELRRLVRFLIEKYRIVGNNTDGEPMNVRPSDDPGIVTVSYRCNSVCEGEGDVQSCAVGSLELDEPTSIDNPRDKLVHVPRLSNVGADDVEYLICELECTKDGLSSALSFSIEDEEED